MKKISLFIFFALLTVFYFIVKLYSSHFTEFLFYNHIEVLNKIAGVPASGTLEFYLGRTEEIIWGPLSILLSGLIFYYFSFYYLKESNAKVFALAILVYLIISKFEILFFPPYGDAIGGPFAEALWLKSHGFNYTGLYHEPGYAFGGPKVYLTSIYPTFLAVLMTLIPSTKLFLLVNHLIVFTLAAYILSLLRQILLHIFDATTALLITVMVAALPLFQSQVEAINMEIPCLFFSMVSVFYLVKKDLLRSCLMAVMATLVKETAVAMCANVFVIGMLIYFCDKKYRYTWGIFIPSVAAIIFACGKVFLKFVMKDQHVSEGLIHFLAGWPSLRWSIILVLYLFSLVIFIVWCVRKIPKMGSFRLFLEKNYPVFVLFVSAGMWYLLFLNFLAVSPRYRLLLAPFLVFCVSFSLSVTIKKEKILHTFLFIVMSFFFLSSYGFCYTPMEENDHVLLERSLEYRNDLKVNLQTAKELEEKYSNYLVAAPFTLAQMFAFPELGYVHKKLSVMIYGMRCMYGDIKNFEKLEGVDVRHTVWVGVKTHLADELPIDVEYPIGPYDKLIKEVVVGNKKATIFMGGFAIEKMRRMMELARARILIKSNTP